MSPTPLPSLRELFPDLMEPRGDDDPKTGSRLITPQLILDRVNPNVRSEEQPSTPTAPDLSQLTRLRRDLDPEPGRPPSEASSPAESDDCHDYLKTRKHVCHRCGKRFNRPSSLAIHYYTHTGERPYPCPHPGCLRTFNVSSNMRRHYKNHDFLANNRSQPQTKIFQTSFYSPPALQPDVYPPPPLQWGFR